MDKSKAEILVEQINDGLSKDPEVNIPLANFWITKIQKQDNVFVYKEFPEIEVKYEDLIQMKDEEKYRATIDRIRNNNAIQNVEPVVVPPVAEVTPINNPAPVSEELQSTPDMLVNTGLTKFNMSPVDGNTVVEQKEPEKAVVTELPPMPNKMVKKPLTFTKPTPKANKQAGFAEVIVLGVVVLVYVVIIVNLIIRLK